MRGAKVLIVDDDDEVRDSLARLLNTYGYDIATGSDCASALTALTTDEPDVAVVDYSLPDGNAIELLEQLAELEVETPIVVLTGHGTIELAVEALQEGAVHFLTKPVQGAALRVILDRALEGRRQQRLINAQRKVEQRRRIDPFLGASQAIRQLEKDARRIATVESPVLILGETGSGKGTLARWLHDNGSRSAHPFVDLNCAALSKELLESELFGYARGAFTGAVDQKAGLLEAAHGGTLFLDEIGDLDPQIQPRLLKVIEEKRFRRLGEVRERTVDVRLMVATHRDLRLQMERSTFREDLFFRVSTFQLLVPPLRHRREDIPELATLLLTRIASDLGRSSLRLTAEAEAALIRYSWPGNIRELRNVLERAALFADGGRIYGEDLRFDAMSSAEDPLGTGESTANSQVASPRIEQQRGAIEAALRAENWNVGRAAERLDMPRSTLYLRIKQLQIRLPGR
ncbi:MAG: sigma-54 dependent transcriptional regulator [Acidobacteriota bacterium]|nr:sigma-54 dependent transcriptional regulator [Acidobacteriota bacterium]